MKIDLSEFHPAVIEAAKIARRRPDLKMLAAMADRCDAQLKNGPPCPRKIIVSAAFQLKRDSRPLGDRGPTNIATIPDDYQENGSDYLENRIIDNSDPLEILLALESAAQKIEQREWQNLADQSDQREKIFQFSTAELAAKTGLTKRAIQYERKKLIQRIDFEPPNADQLAADAENRVVSSQLQLWG